RFLVAAGDERVQRQRIRVGDRVLLFDEDAQHAGFEQREIGRRHGGGSGDGSDSVSSRKTLPRASLHGHAAIFVESGNRWRILLKSPAWRCSAISRTSRSASATPTTRNSTSARCSNACC